MVMTAICARINWSRHCREPENFVVAFNVVKSIYFQLRSNHNATNFKSLCFSLLFSFKIHYFVIVKLIFNDAKYLRWEIKRDGSMCDTEEAEMNTQNFDSSMLSRIEYLFHFSSFTFRRFVDGLWPASYSYYPHESTL